MVSTLELGWESESPACEQRFFLNNLVYYFFTLAIIGWNIYADNMYRCLTCNVVIKDKRSAMRHEKTVSHRNRLEDVWITTEPTLDEEDHTSSNNNVELSSSGYQPLENDALSSLGNRSSCLPSETMLQYEFLNQISDDEDEFGDKSDNDLDEISDMAADSMLMWRHQLTKTI
jgi:hypothetical protein